MRATFSAFVFAPSVFAESGRDVFELLVVAEGGREGDTALGTWMAELPGRDSFIVAEELLPRCARRALAERAYRRAVIIGPARMCPPHQAQEREEGRSLDSKQRPLSRRASLLQKEDWPDGLRVFERLLSWPAAHH